jgi:hypothetical protein
MSVKFPELIYKLIRYVPTIFFLFLLVPLSYSVFESGYWLSFSFDELLHANYGYLIAEGWRPFADFFIIYSPVFHVLLAPILKLFSYSFSTVYIIRILMIILFAVRLILAGLLVKRVFRSQAAFWIFILLSLIDPFTVYVGMQIRPDNLMMLFLTASLFLLYWSVRTGKQLYWNLTALLTGLALLISLKIAPVIIIIVLFVVIYNFRNKQISQIVKFAILSAFPLIIFAFLFLVQGSFVKMIQMLVFDSKAVIDVLWFPTRFGFFYEPNNSAIYGLGGTPLNWQFTRILPVLAAFGTLLGLLKPASGSRSRWFTLIFALAVIAEYLFLKDVKATFIQYYLPFNFMLLLLATDAVPGLLRIFKHIKPIYYGLIIIFCLSLFALTKVSITANLERIKFLTSHDLIANYERRWKIISPTDLAYPEFMFRPLSHVIPYGYFIPELPESVLSRFPDALVTVQNPKVKFALLSDYYFQHMDPQVESYIKSNFQKDPADPELWIRIK